MASPIPQIENRKIVTYRCGKLRGEFVKSGADRKAITKQESIESTRQLRKQCQNEAEAKGLLTV